MVLTNWGPNTISKSFGEENLISKSYGNSCDCTVGPSWRDRSWTISKGKKPRSGTGARRQNNNLCHVKTRPNVAQTKGARALCRRPQGGINPPLQSVAKLTDFLHILACIWPGTGDKDVCDLYDNSRLGRKIRLFSFNHLNRHIVDLA